MGGTFRGGGWQWNRWLALLEGNVSCWFGAGRGGGLARMRGESKTDEPNRPGCEIPGRVERRVLDAR